MSQSAGRAHTCAGQTTLDAQDTGALLSLVSLALCFLHRLCHTSQTDVLTLCANVLLSFSLLPPSVFIRDGWCPHTLHTSPLVTTMQTVAAGSSHVCASEPARRTQTHTHTHTHFRSRIVRLSRSLFVVPLQSLTITPIPESPKRKSTLRAHLHSVQIGDTRAPQRSSWQHGHIIPLALFLSLALRERSRAGMTTTTTTSEPWLRRHARLSGLPQRAPLQVVHRQKVVEHVDRDVVEELALARRVRFSR